MKKALLLIPFFILLMLSACGKDLVQDDLLDYINNQLPPLIAENDAILQDYNDVIGDNNKNDNETYNVINNKVIPKYKVYSEKIEGIRPKTEEVRQLHELYIASTNKQYNALVQLVSAYKNNDANLVGQANEKMDESNKAYRDFQSKLEQLAKQHKVVFKGK